MMNRHSDYFIGAVFDDPDYSLRRAIDCCHRRGAVVGAGR